MKIRITYFGREFTVKVPAGVTEIDIQVPTSAVEDSSEVKKSSIIIVSR